jgi:hypothetical protein
MSMMLLITMVGLTLPGWWRLSALVLPLAYATTLALVGVSHGTKIGWQVSVLFPVAAAIMHTAYAAGFVWGLFKNPYTAVPMNNNTGECHVSRT